MASDRCVFRRAKRILLVLTMVVALTALDFGLLSSGGHSQHDHMGLMTAQAAESFTAGQALLPRTGWTATASDSYSRNPPSNVLDGNTATIWHSKWDGTPVPLPHVITIDMQAVQKVAGLSYLPRQDGKPNGTIGRYAVTTSTDGTDWSDPVVSGVWNDDSRRKSVVFPPVVMRISPPAVVTLWRLTASTSSIQMPRAVQWGLCSKRVSTRDSMILRRLPRRFAHLIADCSASCRDWPNRSFP